MQSIRTRSIAALFAIIATAASIAGVSPAQAATVDAVTGAEVRQAVVPLGGVVLSSPEGRALIDRRIRFAAARVCGQMDHKASPAILACRRAAIADATARLDEKTAQQFAAR